MTTTPVPATVVPARECFPTGAIVDVDVHAYVPNLDALVPYMSSMWVDWCRERGWPGPKSVTAHYPAGTERACRPEWRPTDGRVPASSVELLASQCLDPQDVTTAILTCYYGVESIRQPDWAVAMARAVNDWIAAEWLDADPRLRGTIVIPPRDPVAMVAEIKRLGDDPRFVQVLLPVRNDALWGQRLYFPVLEAIAEHGLVANLHFGGVVDGTPSTTGHPSWFVEEYAAEWQSYAGQITSLVSEGVFQSFPELRFTVCEGGFLWVPMWGWRMNKEWRGLRREVPWLDEAPYDVIKRHFRFSTSPMEAGSPEHLQRVMAWFEGAELLMYASDYPHGNRDDLGALLAAVSETARPLLMAGTAIEWYRL